MYNLHSLNIQVNKVKGKKFYFKSGEPIWEELLEIVGDTIMFNLLSNKLILLPINNDSFVQITGEPLSSYLEKKRFSHHYNLKKNNYKLKIPKEFKKKKEKSTQPSLNDPQPVVVNKKEISSQESNMEIESSNSTVISATPEEEMDSECDSFIILIEYTPDEEELKKIREFKKASELKAFEIPKELDLSAFPQEELKTRKKKKNKRQRNKIIKESVKVEKDLIKNNSKMINRKEMLYSRNFKIYNQFPKDRKSISLISLLRCFE
jgi:hypothetical protein